jgi:hypothetical protein
MGTVLLLDGRPVHTNDELMRLPYDDGSEITQSGPAYEILCKEFYLLVSASQGVVRKKVEAVDAEGDSR